MSKIIGVTVGTPVPQSDWNQNDPNKADYIKNKPVVEQEYDENSTNAQSGKAVAEAIAGIKDGGGGENGATFTPSVSNDGVISWTNDKGLPNPSPANIKGYTPVRGTDYWTEADKAEIKSYVDEAILGGAW